MSQWSHIARDLLNRLRRRAAGDAFAEWAATYDEDDNPLIEAEQPVMEELVGNLSGAAVLDLGCGTGRLMRLARQHGARSVVGLDSCPAMIHRATGARVCADMTCLPFAHASFDCVLAGLAVGHLASLEGFAREAARVLRPRGRLVCSDLHPCGYWLGWKRTYRRADRSTDAVPWHVHTFADIHRALQTADLHLVDVREPTVRHTPRICPAALLWVARREK